MKMIDKIFHYIYLPVCRTYARHVLGDKPVDTVMRSLCVPYFLYRHRYWPHFKEPRTFSEKIWHRMFYNRNPLLTIISDKYRVRDYVANKCGYEYLIPLLWHGDNPQNIPYDDLPNKFVIKTNHGCGYNIIVQDKTQLDKEKTEKQISAWLSENFCQDKILGLPWGYKNIEPHIVVEQFIGENGQVPIDYKFFCYEGRAEFVLMTFDRIGNHREKHFNRDFEPLDLWNGAPQYTGNIQKPKNYREMLQLADSLAKGLDFIRVDLYSVGSRIYFGELTCYPGGGITRFVPREYDFIFGEKWYLK